MFSLSTVYWILSLYDDVNFITASFMHEVSYDVHMPLLNALVLLKREYLFLMKSFNDQRPIVYVNTDGVVVWRAWVICQDGYSKNFDSPPRVLMLDFPWVLVLICLS